jgi:hypothetical protein
MVTLSLTSCQDAEKQVAAGSCLEAVIFLGHILLNMSFVVILPGL